MPDNPPIREGQILTGVLFNEPMRVETVRSNGPDTVIAGLVGTKSERFRSVTLTIEQIRQLTILDTASTYNGDGKLLRLGLQAYSLGIARSLEYLLRVLTEACKHVGSQQLSTEFTQQCCSKHLDVQMRYAHY